jgi:adenylosuccinate lyase
MRMRDVFDNISPIDYRYWDPEVAEYLSENGFTYHKLLLEIALAKVLHKRGICSEDVVREIKHACN